MLPAETEPDDPDWNSWPVVGWAAAWFFFILLSYFIVRPIRETMGAIGGTRELQGLMLATFVAMLIAVPAYSALVNRLSRKWLVRVVYHFFCVSLVLFSLALSMGNEAVRVWAARTFFLWVNVYALFATSVFWSVLAELLSSDEGKKLFGKIAAGGTAGAIAGSFLTSQIAPLVSTSTLLLVPIVTLQVGLACAWRLERAVANEHRLQSGGGDIPEKPITGGLFDGITRVFRSPYLASICLYLFFVQGAGTQLYFQQAEIVGRTVPDDGDKTTVFAYLDFATQSLTLVGQLFLSSWILRRIGVWAALVTLPIAYFVCFVALSFHSELIVVAVAAVLSRSCAYGIIVPSREVLFTVVSREDKYKSKSFIDTVVLRGSDATASQVFGSLRNFAGLGFQAINLWTLPLIGVWAFAAVRLGLRQQRLANEITPQKT